MLILTIGISRSPSIKSMGRAKGGFVLSAEILVVDFVLFSIAYLECHEAQAAAAIKHWFDNKCVNILVLIVSSSQK